MPDPIPTNRSARNRDIGRQYQSVFVQPGRQNHRDEPAPVLPHPTPPDSPNSLNLIATILLMPVRLVVALIGIALGVAFLIAPWIIMTRTGLMDNSNAIGGKGVFVEAGCGIWGLANVVLALPALGLFLTLLVWAVAGKWLLKDKW